MQAADPCNVCGSKDLYLLDGFYYCVECGTQDTNVRETIWEQKFLADGTTGISIKKKIAKINEDKVDMSPEWYKWHAFNFVLLGLADELIALGVPPSFKKKLLWIWTRYIKKYQNKEDLGLSNYKEGDNSPNNTTDNFINIEEGTEYNEGLGVEEKRDAISKKPANDVQFYSQALFVTMLYVALNLDKNDVQITHITRMIDEGRLNLLNSTRHIPEGINVKAIGVDWHNFAVSCNTHHFFSIFRYRTVAMTLLKELGLGTPLLPDLRRIINNFIVELCLPMELKNLVFSLMHFRPCELDVDYEGQEFLKRVPEYEAVAMSYVIVALKMCFGLDGDYEYKLSDVVDKMNEKRLHPKSYKLGFTPEPTNRLFSFRDWINYLHLRRKILSKYLQLNIDGIHYNDANDFVFLEYLPERFKRKAIFTDELAMKILDQIPEDADIDAIPKDEFPWSLTPLTAYTEVITRHCKDPEVVQFLSEDFAQYSLKYASDELELSDFEDAKNVVKGITKYKKNVVGREVVLHVPPIKPRHNWIYIKNCDNKHWLKTKKPSIEHVTVVSSDKNDQENRHDRESDHGYDSNIENSPSDQDITENVCKEIDEVELETIKEEEEGKNIFDDDFNDMHCKEEDKAEDDNDFDLLLEQTEYYNDQQEESDDDKSVSSEDSFEFNPETFNRERAIKELILQACRKYKIPTPKEYKTVEPKKRKREYYDDESGQPRRKHTSKPGEAKMEINKLLEAYYSNVERDVVGQIAQQVKNVIQNMDCTKEQIDTEGPPIDIRSETNSMIINNQTPNASIMSVVEQNTNEHNTIQVECEQENMESTLFEDDSDIEANIDELMPKGDPRYDEKEYNVDQLYIKIDKIETDDIFDVPNCPEIDKILDEKIEHFKNTRKASRKRPTSIHTESSDSEDELPLSNLKKNNEMPSKECEEEDFEPLIKKNKIPKFKYWLRHYNSRYFLQRKFIKEKFNSEVAQNMPETFNFVLNECAFVSSCSPFRLYRNVQILEKNLFQNMKLKWRT